MLGWVNHKLESRLLGEISTASDIQMIPPYMAESEEELKSLFMRVKEKSEKPGFKLNIQKMKIVASSPITSWQMGKMWKQHQISFSWAPESMWTVTAAMKLKDTCSLEEKL